MDERVLASTGGESDSRRAQLRCGADPQRLPPLAGDAQTWRLWRRGIELDRKGIHLTATLLAVWTYYLNEPIATGGLVIVTLFVLAVDRARLALRRWGLWMYRRFPFVFRRDERHIYSGASVMMIGVTLTSALFDCRPATAGILCLTWGDSAAALVGQFYTHWRQRRKQRRAGTRILPAVSKRRHKTIAGTLGCLIVSMLMIALVMAGAPFLPHEGGWGLLAAVIIAGGAAAALMERYTPGRWDNLTMPLATAAIVQLIATWGR
jgi:dolichol kinase